MAGTLQHLGYVLGTELLAAQEGVNERGFFENAAVVHCHEQALRAMASHWSDFRPYGAADWQNPELEQVAKKLQEVLLGELAGEGRFVVKDPRQCRLLPLWERAVEGLRLSTAALLIFRHPFEVAQSLQRRDGLGADHALALWLSCTLDAERATRGWRRAFIAYPGLLDDWRECLGRAFRQLGTPLRLNTLAEREIDAFLSADLKHHRDTDWCDGHPALRQAVLDVLRLLLESQSGELSARQVEFDACAEATRRAIALSAAASQAAAYHCRLYHAAVKEWFARDGENQRLDELRRQMSAELDSVNGLREAQQAELEKLGDECAAQRAELERVDGIRSALRAELDSVNGLREAQQAELAKLSCIRHELWNELAAVNRVREEQQRVLAALSCTVDEQHTQLATLESAYRECLGERDELFASLEQRRAELSDSQAAVERQAGELQALRAELNNTQLINAQLGEALAMSRNLVSILENSLSWRLTRPLRQVNAWRQRQMRRISSMGRVIAGAHSRTELLRRGHSVLKRRGLKHVVKHLARYLRETVRLREREVLRLPMPTNADWDISVFLPVDVTGSAPHHDVKVSVIIPVYNAGVEFEWLLRKLTQQKGVRDLEIVVVDSGSKDDSVSVARRHGCVVIEIPNEEFSHSHSRNLGASKATGDYLLFMVQDAYPAGDYWLNGLLTFLQTHRDERLAAVSASEFPRADSDVMYDSCIDTHYRFLGCHLRDRLGEWQGDDNESLRRQGQLSDVTCLIARERFQAYGYQGDYAEDLDLGMRLIRAGERVAMMASVKSIHSHNRPAYYYLKRSFVDVIFLVDKFADFPMPVIRSLRGMVLGFVDLACCLSELLTDKACLQELSSYEQFEQRVLESLRLRDDQFGEAVAFSTLDAKVAAFVGRLVTVRDAFPMMPEDDSVRREMRDAFEGRFRHVGHFAKATYPRLDDFLFEELLGLIQKTLAATIGSYLAFAYLKYRQDAAWEAFGGMSDELVAGV
ncbi:MAG: glycosyltransferase [Gammaproteobacteria bacterium]|nr:glycosyltransferase [Gammaproteobacteria bacterium]